MKTYFQLSSPSIRRLTAVLVAFFALSIAPAEARKKKEPVPETSEEQKAREQEKAEAKAKAKARAKEASEKKKAEAAAAEEKAREADEHARKEAGKKAAAEGKTIPADGKKTQPPATGPPAVPGGGLEAHELAGGHLLERHVGKTEAELVARLQEQRNIVSSSSFTSQPVAEAVIGLMIARRQEEIQDWLRSGEQRLALDFFANKPVGISVSRRTMKAEPVRGVRLVLERDARFPGGWRILTGYPQL